MILQKQKTCSADAACLCVISYLHYFFLGVRLELVLHHVLLSPFLSDVREGLDGSVVRDSRLEHVEHAGLTVDIIVKHNGGQERHVSFKR